LKNKSPEVVRLARRPYPMRVYQEPDSGDWVAEVIDLPGCLGVGDTPEEAVKVAKGFIKDWLEEALAQGWTVPEPTKRPGASGKFVVRLPRSLHARLQELSEIEGTSLNQLVVSLLSERTTHHELRTKLEHLVVAPQLSPSWGVAWYAFAAVTPAPRVRRQGAYSAQLEYSRHPTLVAETPGFDAWAAEAAKPPKTPVRGKAKGGGA
jgi:antitoxin HicB